MQKIIDAVKTIKRPNTLLRLVEETDYLTAPASTKYHLCRPGGLAEHSWNVYHLLLADGTPVRNMIQPVEAVRGRQESQVLLACVGHASKAQLKHA